MLLQHPVGAQAGQAQALDPPPAVGALVVVLQVVAVPLRAVGGNTKFSNINDPAFSVVRPTS